MPDTQVTDRMVNDACDAYEGAVEFQAFRPHAHLMREALEAALADYTLIPTSLQEGESMGLEDA